MLDAPAPTLLLLCTLLHTRKGHLAPATLADCYSLYEAQRCKQEFLYAVLTLPSTMQTKAFSGMRKILMIVARSSSGT